MKSQPEVQEAQEMLAPSLGRDSRGGGPGSPLQRACLENPMDRGAWRATARGVATARHD